MKNKKNEIKINYNNYNKSQPLRIPNYLITVYLILLK